MSNESNVPLAQIAQALVYQAGGAPEPSSRPVAGEGAVRA
jgi:hypothetical protein